MHKDPTMNMNFEQLNESEHNSKVNKKKYMCRTNTNDETKKNYAEVCFQQ